MKTLHSAEYFPPGAVRNRTARLKVCIFLQPWTRSRKWTSEKGCASWRPVTCSQAWPYLESSWIWEELELPGQGPVSCDRTVIKSPISVHPFTPTSRWILLLPILISVTPWGFLVLFFQEVVFKKKKLGQYIVRICELITTFAINDFQKYVALVEEAKASKPVRSSQTWEASSLETQVSRSPLEASVCRQQACACAADTMPPSTMAEKYQEPPESKHWSLLKSVSPRYGAHFKNELFKQIRHDHSCKK